MWWSPRSWSVSDYDSSLAIVVTNESISYIFNTCRADHSRAGTNQERTFLAVKPDGVQRGLIGDIIARFEKRGYKLVGLKMVWPTTKMAENHYKDLAKKPFYPSLTQFFSSGPIICMCWEGKVYCTRTSNAWRNSTTGIKAWFNSW